MFILRRITSEDIEINWCIGDKYTLVLKEKNLDEFSRTAKLMKWEPAPTEVYGFLSCDGGIEVIPLYENSHYFIMASDGRTVANISMRK